MKVLMLGWEYPPHINGGLGTACLGITTALSKIKDINLVFALPKVYGDENATHMQLVEPKSKAQNAIKSAVSAKLIKIKFRNHIKKVTFSEALNPYWTGKEYEKFLNKYKLRELYGTKSNIKESGFKLLRKYIKLNFDKFLKINKLAFQVIKYASNVISYFQDEDFDVIHAHDWMTILPAVVLAKITRKPLVVQIHSLEYDRSGVFNDYYVNQIEKIGVTNADLVIAVSKYTKSVIIREHGVSEDKIRVVYNAVMLNKKKKYFLTGALKKYKIVLFLGRITRQKGPEYFIDASLEVIKKYKNVKFIMAGDGDLTAKMIEKTIRLGIYNYFIFTGFLKKKEVEKVFSISDIFVMPSFSEPFGIVALEAIYHDAALVISKQSGCSEVIKSALKCDYWDSKKIAEHILYLLENENMRKKLIQKSKEDLKALSWSKSAKELHNIYKEVIANEAMKIVEPTESS